jgi:hypothetical protein
MIVTKQKFLRHGIVTVMLSRRNNNHQTQGYIMKTRIIMLCAAATIAMPNAALAQTTSDDVAAMRAEIDALKKQLSALKTAPRPQPKRAIPK